MIDPDVYIQGSFSDLDRQATQSAGGYLREAQRYIDECFGFGYAAKHPELVATFIQVANAEFCNSSMAKVMQDAFYKIAIGVRAIADHMERSGDEER